jgi:hypothetical protein
MLSDRRAQIVEIVGPAGAGKTTLYRALSHHNQYIQPGNFPDVRNISNIPFFFWNVLQISPALIGLPKNHNRKLTRRELAWLSILRGWPNQLKQGSEQKKIIVLDQGPVYLMAETSEFGPDYLREQKADKFWKTFYSRWANTLDMIIWLDTADAYLVDRIRNRDKDHVIKNESVETTLDFLARYREAYERIISSLVAANTNLKVRRFDTARSTTEEIAIQLLYESGSI